MRQLLLLLFIWNHIVLETIRSKKNSDLKTVINQSDQWVQKWVFGRVVNDISGRGDDPVMYTRWYIGFFDLSSTRTECNNTREVCHFSIIYKWHTANDVIPYANMSQVTLDYCDRSICQTGTLFRQRCSFRLCINADVHNLSPSQIVILFIYIKLNKFISYLVSQYLAGGIC